MKKVAVKLIASGVVSILTIFATIGLAGACYSGLYQPQVPRKEA